MNGCEVCEIPKKDPEAAEIPIVFLAALSESKDKIRGFKSGAVDYIIKPIDVAEVRGRTRSHLSLRLARMQLREQNAARAPRSPASPCCSVLTSAAHGLDCAKARRQKQRARES